jgi:hypothetical protein
MPFMLIVALVAAPSRPPPPVAHDVVLLRVSACGLERSRIRVEYVRAVQDDLVIVGAGPIPSRNMMQCIARVSRATIYEVHFEDQASQAIYNPIYFAGVKAEERREARTWLPKRGKLAALPRYDPKQSLASYAQRLESYCGVRPGSTLAVASPNLLTWPDRLNPPAPGPGATCVTRAISASNLSRYGIMYGFYGNAAVKDLR